MPLVEVTPAAAEHIKRLKEREQKPEAYLRMRVTGGGCSGLQYQLGFDDEMKDGDTTIDASGVRVLVDEKSALYLAGITLDYVDTLMESGFKMVNPNATSTCGCGESFAV